MTHKTFREAILTIGFSLFLSSCGVTENSSTASPKAIQHDVSALAGKWKTPCAGRYLHFTEAVEVEGDRFTKVVSLFEDKDCKVGLHSERIVYKILKIDTSNAQINSIDLLFQRWFKTPLSEGGAHFLNARNRRRGTCGVSNWQHGVEIEITSLPCDPYFPAFVPNETKYYQIYSLQNQSLFFGSILEGRMGATEETRPISLQDDLPFVKEAH